MNLFRILFFLMMSTISFSQMNEIDPSVYNEWNTLSNHRISNNGKYVSYEINPHQGDGYLYVYSIENAHLDSFPRGKKAIFSGESNYIAFKIVPGYDTLRNCELHKVNKKKWPKDSLGIYLLGKDSLIKIDNVVRYELNESSDWMTFMSGTNDLDEEPTKKRKCIFRKKKEEETPYTSKGKLLSIYNPTLSSKKQIKDVQSSQLSENGTNVVFTTLRTFDKVDSVDLYLYSTSSASSSRIGGGYTTVPKFSLNEQESHLVYLSASDTSKVKHYSLELYALDTKDLRVLADTNSTFFPKSDGISEHASPFFTKGSELIYFGVSERGAEEPKDTLIDSEKIKLDLWHHADNRLQPQQLLEASKDEKKVDLFIYRVADNQFVQLGDDTLRVRPTEYVEWDAAQGTDHFFLGASREPYAHTYNWESPRKVDYYLVSGTTGEKTLIKKGALFGAELSPAGKSLVYFESDKQNYYSLDLKTRTETCITCSIDNVLWTYDMNGMPMKAYPYEIIGWKRGEDKIYMQSEFDIWEYEFSTGNVVSITNEEGSLNDIKLRAEMWSEDSVYINFDNLYVRGQNRQTKATHFYSVIHHADHTDLEEKTVFNANVFGLIRSKNSTQIIGRKMTYIDYPEVYLMDNEFMTIKKISATNPQQSEYKWGTVETMQWTSYDGIELEGLLYKPTDFTATENYPLMVYFYELYSDRFHNHYIPKPTASIIYPTEYNSAGYVVFIPDVRYRPGHPGQSAYDCIMSGTDKVLELYPNIDSTRMALQGQSWGGYQTAQLVTMTTRYKAAMAGAPVTNMFSAYGGIRWKSGLNRQFQYEHTQSRIGYTIWERPDLYIENSPQFHLPNVETPLLIMHNDTDGAVPWYQGIELFTGLKRLGKETWLLNYNGEQHNLMKNANRMDLSIRMRQFFDHYLLGKEAPKWLLEGIPATVKGKELRY